MGTQNQERAPISATVYVQYPVSSIQCWTSKTSKTMQELTVLGTSATFSATAPLAQTEKGGACRGGAKVKYNGAVAVARK